MTLQIPYSFIVMLLHFGHGRILRSLICSAISGSCCSCFRVAFIRTPQPRHFTRWFSLLESTSTPPAHPFVLGHAHQSGKRTRFLASCSAPMAAMSSGAVATKSWSGVIGDWHLGAGQGIHGMTSLSRIFPAMYMVRHEAHAILCPQPTIDSGTSAKQIWHSSEAAAAAAVEPVPPRPPELDEPSPGVAGSAEIWKRAPVVTLVPDMARRSICTREPSASVSFAFVAPRRRSASRATWSAFGSTPLWPPPLPPPPPPPPYPYPYPYPCPNPYP
mmetsp:Transcript_15748/g.28322  ORF Transcript_15748/g.28322 Transcript_15748/m.28322 type:complete len:273 (-) Transcript_15748:778-1596(-)